jgi:peptide subunit release factor 1 (eRF1)
MNLLKHIKELAACKPRDAPFISLYLNTRGTESGKRHYEIFLKEKLNFFEKEFAGNGDIEKSFKKSWVQIDHYLNNKLELKSNGAALFSRWQPNENFFLPLQFPVPLENRFVVDSVPHIFPLVQCLDTSHHYMVMISDSEKAKIFEIQFGGIKDIQQIEKPEKEKSFRGEWAQMHYQNWKKNQTMKFLKQKIKILADLMQRNGVEHLILAGDDVMLARIKERLPKWLQERVVDFAQLHARTDEHEILRQTLETFADFERAEDVDTLVSLRRELLTDGLGVMGTERTVEALNSGKIDQLIVATEYDPPSGWLCGSCDFLGVGHISELCRYCGQNRLREVNVREEMVRKTLLSGACVETIVHNVWFMRQGGVGALLRYK